MKYRNLFNLSREKWQNLCHVKGIGPAKSITLEAAFEISRRINVHTEEAEFDQWIWAEPVEAVKRVVDFKRDNYQNALIELGVLDKKDFL